MAALRPAHVFGLMAATIAASYPEGSYTAVEKKPEGKGLPMPKQKHAGGCNGAACRTLDVCICDCKQCRACCNGQ